VNPAIRHFILVSSIGCALLFSSSTARASERLPSLSLEQAVLEALSANIYLKARQFDVDAARAEIISARLRANPELVVEYDNFKPSRFYAEETETLVALEYTFESWGKRRHRIQEASLASRVAELEFEDAIRELVFDVQSAAIDILLAESDVTIAKDNLEMAETIVRLNEARYQVGDIDGIELRRSRLLLPQARHELRQAEADLDEALRDFNLLLGRDEPVFSVSADFRRDVAVNPLNVAMQQALERRPDFQAARAEWQRAQADLTLQQAERKPDITVGSGMRRFRGDGTYAALSVSVPLQFFDRNQGEIARARADSYRADADMQWLQADIRNELRKAHQRLLLNLELLDSLQMELADAEELRRVTELSYRAGEAGLLDILDAMSVYNDTSSRFNDLRADLARDFYYFDFLTAAPVMP
jgi:cobalt-zinc-cadmium efflux system outer membrane protein